MKWYQARPMVKTRPLPTIAPGKKFPFYSLDHIHGLPFEDLIAGLKLVANETETEKVKRIRERNKKRLWKKRRDAGENKYFVDSEKIISELIAEKKSLEFTKLSLLMEIRELKVLMMN